MWQQDEPRRTRRLALLLAAAVPWLVLLVVLVRPATSAVGDVAIETPRTTEHDHPAVPDGPTEAVTVPTTAVPTAQIHGDMPSATHLAGAVALVVARAHLGTVGPAPVIDGLHPGPPGRYVEHVTVERVDMPAPGAAVVTVLAVLLTASDDHYDGVEVVRLAVPIVFDGPRAAPAGQPWRLQDPSLDMTAPDVVPDERPDVADAVHAALAAAGFGQVEQLRVAGSDGWPLVAEFSGIGPGQDAPGNHVLWLRRHLDGFVVAGTSAPQETQP